ncbi:hypothetical protein D3C78_1359480 [compost metagenome]
MTIDAHALDTDAQQCLADAFNDLGALRVQAFDVAAKQHFAGQAKLPALVSQFKALLFEDRNLRRGQAFLRRCLATGQGQYGHQQHSVKRSNGQCGHESQLLVCTESTGCSVPAVNWAPRDRRLA